MFHPWVARNHKQHARKAERFACAASDFEVAIVNGIERASHNAQTARTSIGAQLRKELAFARLFDRTAADTQKIAHIQAFIRHASLAPGPTHEADICTW